MKSPGQRIVWITGAGSGIGKASAEYFASAGDHIIATARTKSKLRDVKNHSTASGGVCDVFVCDVRDQKSITRVSNKILKTYHTVDVLVNNAGITSFNSFLETPEKIFKDIVATNLLGTYLVTRAVLPSMIKQKKGLILNVISYAAKEVFKNSAAYSASKSGTAAMMKVLREEVRSEGIKIINVYPGAVATSIWHPGVQEKYKGKMLKAEEIAKTLYQLTLQPELLMVEEVTLRPQQGNLTL